MSKQRYSLLFLLRTRVQLRAALYRLFMSLLATRQEVAKKRAKTFPLGSPLQREKVAALALCSSFREVIKIQILRARVKETRTHLRAKFFEFSARRA